jgi:hypothetical protein
MSEKMAYSCRKVSTSYTSDKRLRPNINEELTPIKERQFFLVVLRIEPRVLWMLTKYTVIWFMPRKPSPFLSQGLTTFAWAVSLSVFGGIKVWTQGFMLTQQAVPTWGTLLALASNSLPIYLRFLSRWYSKCVPTCLTWKQTFLFKNVPVLKLNPVGFPLLSCFEFLLCSRY